MEGVDELIAEFQQSLGNLNYREGDNPTRLYSQFMARCPEYLQKNFLLQLQRAVVKWVVAG